jgi:rhodanese-related sulfurtransferase
MKQISPAELAAWLADPTREQPFLLDVREPWEYDKARIPGSQLLPMGEVAARLGEIHEGKDVVAICHHGGRSMQVAMFLERAGFGRVYNLAGGVDAWARQIDPSMATY